MKMMRARVLMMCKLRSEEIKTRVCHKVFAARCIFFFFRVKKRAGGVFRSSLFTLSLPPFRAALRDTHRVFQLAGYLKEVRTTCGYPGASFKSARIKPRSSCAFVCARISIFLHSFANRIIISYNGEFIIRWRWWESSETSRQLKIKGGYNT